MPKSILCLAFAVCLSAAPVLAEVIHVPDDYPTIQGINAASSGDIVMVAANEYFEEITLRAGVIVQGTGQGLCIINGGGDTGDVVTAVGNDIDNDTKLIGFTLTGAISGGSMPGGGGVFCNSGASPEISNNRIEGNDIGVATWNNSSALIHNNVVIDNNYTAISLSSASPVINNTIAYNNTGIYDSGGYEPTIMNNVVVSNTNTGMGCVNQSVPTDISYNDVWNNGTDYHNCNPGPGDISVDPVFEDEAGGDYHLAEGSPCIDAGNPAPEYNDPDGTRNDMGAYGGPGAEADIPFVSLTSPSQDDLNVDPGVDVAAVFSVDMDSETLTPQTCIVSGELTGIRLGNVTYDALGRTVTINPDANFLWGERVTAVLTKEIESAGGIALSGFAWQFTSASGGGSGQFDVPATYSAGASPNGLAAADFNGDGHVDLSVANATANTVTILLGAGDGSFTLFGSYPTGMGPNSLCAADLDADGDLDLAVANENSNEVSVLLGNGDGSYSPATDHPVGIHPLEVCCGDFDLDGNIDLATANALSNNISVLLGQGGGAFAPAVPYTAGVYPHSITVGDVDHDGILDLVVATKLSDELSVFLGAGDGTFGPARHDFTGDTPVCVRLADLDADGDLDAAVVNESLGRVSILEGDGNGDFSLRHTGATGGMPRNICISDVNADGYLDLSVSNRDTDNISVLLAVGDGSVHPATHYRCGQNPHGIVSADFDRDGDRDLCSADHDDGTVSFLANLDALAVQAFDPDQYHLDVPLETDVSSTFNMALDGGTLDNASFILRGRRSGAHLGTISYDDGTHTATLNPIDDFYDGEMVTASLTTDIQAANGVDFPGCSWTFTVAVGLSSEGNFGGLGIFSAGSEPRGLFAADYDGDGDVDLAVTSSNYPNPGRIAILMNQGDGTFDNPMFYSLTAADPIRIFAADLDADADIDLAVAHNEPGTSHLSILRNNGDGTFVQGGTYAPAILGQSVWGGDVDADGDVDLVMTDGWGSSDNVKLLINSGSGTFGPIHTYSAGTFARGVMIEDVENDGDLDMIVASSGDGNLSVLYNDGYGSFPDLTNFSIGTSPSPVWANDLDGDGYVDLVAGGPSHVSVILNNGDGTFGDPAGNATDGSVRSVVGGDLDGDGDIDLAASLSDAQALWVGKNNGDGSFALGSEFDVGDYPWGLQTTDFDLDGDLDLGTAIFNLDRVELLYNTGAAGIDDLVDLEMRLGRGQLVIYPNPFHSGTTIAYRFTERGKGNPIAARIYDVTGRLVRRLTLPADRADVGRGVWDGRDGHGRRIADGIYFLKIQSGEEETTRSVLHVR